MSITQPREYNPPIECVYESIAEYILFLIRCSNNEITCFVEFISKVISKGI